jgi:hypothetical protein
VSGAPRGAGRDGRGVAVRAGLRPRLAGLGAHGRAFSRAGRSRRGADRRRRHRPWAAHGVLGDVAGRPRRDGLRREVHPRGSHPHALGLAQASGVPAVQGPLCGLRRQDRARRRQVGRRLRMAARRHPERPRRVPRRRPNYRVGSRRDPAPQRRRGPAGERFGDRPHPPAGIGAVLPLSQPACPANLARRGHRPVPHRAPRRHQPAALPGQAGDRPGRCGRRLAFHLDGRSRTHPFQGTGLRARGTARRHGLLAHPAWRASERSAGAGGALRHPGGRRPLPRAGSRRPRPLPRHSSRCRTACCLAALNPRSWPRRCSGRRDPPFGRARCSAGRRHACFRPTKPGGPG